MQSLVFLTYVFFKSYRRKTFGGGVGSTRVCTGRVNKFVETHSYHFTPLDSLYDNITDTDEDSDLVADIHPDTLICMVRTELKMVRLQV